MGQIFWIKAIAGDESWVFDYDRENKRQSAEWHTKSCPRPKKPRMSRSRVKNMITAFFFLTALALCTKNLYLQDRQLITPSTKMSWNDFENGSNESERIADDWVLHHDKAPAHTALSIREFLAKENIPALPRPPYSPDLAPCYFCLFPELKPKLKGHHFGTMENIQKIVTDELHTFTENDFRYCCDQWKKTLEPLCDFPRVIL